jgi:hypothetical protein
MKSRQIWPPYQQSLLLGLIVSLSMIILAGPLQAEAQGGPPAGPTMLVIPLAVSRSGCG